MSSYWDAFRDDRERKRRAQRKAELAFYRAAAAEEQRAERAAARQDRAQRADQARQECEAGEAEAARRNAQLAEELERLETVLRVAVPTPPRTAELLRETVPPIPPEPNDELPPRPAWSRFAPPEQPGWLGWRRYERALHAAQAEFRQALAEHERAVRNATEDRRRRLEARRQQVRRDHRRRWDTLIAGVAAEDPDSVSELAAAIIGAVPPLADLLDGGRAVYLPEPRELIAELELPDVEIIPADRAWRYVHTRRAVEPQPRPAADAARRYRDLVSQLALAAMESCFRGMPPELLDVITINGHVPTTDPATGRPARPCLITVTASRSTFRQLDLGHPKLDPQRCLKTLGAVLSPHPYQLEHVTPFIDIDLARYRLATGPEALADLDHRTDLLTMDPYQFEILVRDLFDRMGYRAWRTQSSHDDGIDAVAIREDPVTPVECVIQAKRVRDRVAPEKVQALMGVLQENPTATHGVLVTTSWLSDRARQRARAHRIQTIEGAELVGLIKEHLERDVLISTRPPRPQRS